MLEVTLSDDVVVDEVSDETILLVSFSDETELTSVEEVSDEVCSVGS